MLLMCSDSDGAWPVAGRGRLRRTIERARRLWLDPSRKIYRWYGERPERVKDAVPDR